MAATGRSVMGLGAGTRTWCIADEGSAEGLAYGLLAPLTLGATVFLDECEVDPARAWENLTAEAIQVLVAPAGRLGRVRPSDPPPDHPDLGHLRSVHALAGDRSEASDGAGREAFGDRVSNGWWRPDIGSVCVATGTGANRDADVLGVAVDGFDVTVLVREDDGLREAGTDEVGELALRAPCPSLFTSGVAGGDPFPSRFVDDWYLSGVRGRRDEEGRLRLA